MQRAFTLIELLVVVAIIGILSAIAVPNFLNAQTRAKVSSNIANMRTIFTAVNMMETDKQYLPIDVWDYQTEEGQAILRERFKGVGMRPAGQRTARDILAVLTSPVAYLSEIPGDAFLEGAGDASQRGYESALDAFVYVDSDPKIPGFDMEFFALKNSDQPFHEGDWAVVSVGPDGILGNRETAEDNLARGVPYNPSNGLHSVGDIFIRCGGCVEGCDV